MGRRPVSVDLRRLSGVALLLAGWLLLALYCSGLREREQQAAMNEFQRVVQDGVEQLERAMALQQNILFAARDVIMVTPKLRSDQLALLSQSAQTRAPALLSLFWAPLIPEHGRLALEAEGRALHGAFRVVEQISGGVFRASDLRPVPKRRRYAPVLLVEPPFPDLRPGYDLISRPMLHASLVLAAERDGIYYSGVHRYTSDEQDGEDTLFFGLLAPVLERPDLAPAARRHGMLGMVGSLVRTDLLLRESLLPSLGSGVHFELTALDKTSRGRVAAQVIARSSEQPFAFDPTLTVVSDLRLGQRYWRLRAQPDEAFLADHLSALPLVLGLVGSAGLILLSLYLGLIRSQMSAVTAQVESRTAELRELNNQLQRASSIDGLTQIGNRRLFDDTLAREWAIAARQRQPISLICVDVDYFKRYNDHYGHVAGDHALSAVAQLLAEQASRPADLVARIGGEEFALLLPGEGVDAGLVAERCRQAVLALAIAHQPSRTAPVLTISAGVATLIPDGILTPEILLRRADKALYQAKAEGRNRVVVHRAREWVAKAQR